MRILSLSKKRDHNSTETTSSQYTKCQDKRCELCKIAITTAMYTTENGTVLRRNAELTCKSRDLIYCIICPKCKGEYLGETGCTLNLRVNLHRNQIMTEKYRKLKVSSHIYDCANGDFKIFPFHKCNKDDHIYREEMEKYYRNKTQARLH